jgi:hypothetical protein
MKCSVCRGVAVFMKHDVTATGPMRKTAFIECEQPECPELVTRGTMREHLELKCSFNTETCSKPGCNIRYVSLRGSFLCLSPHIFHAYMYKWRQT